MKEELIKIKETAAQELSTINTLQDLEGIRVKYLGKKGNLTEILKQMGKLSPQERPVVGQIANEVRNFINE